MPKIKKYFITALSALLLVALIISVFFIMPRKTQNVYAERNNNAFTIIGEENNDIYNYASKTFNLDLMKELYKAIAGVDNFSALEQKVNADPDKALTSADFRTTQTSLGHSNYNVSVWFGGKKWDAVYLTKSKSGDIVLDLWQSADNVSSTKSSWANRSHNNLSDNQSDQYPDNMYSTSLIRVKTLNAGGYMSINNTNLDSYTPQDENNIYGYARFTMPNSNTLNNSVLAYILQPEQIAYQETENVTEYTTFQNTAPNDAYGTPLNEKWYDNNINYTGKASSDGHEETNYEAWKKDYLWLPSITETGRINTGTDGIWKTDVSLKSSISEIWSRTGRNGPPVYTAYTLKNSGDLLGYQNVDTLCAVRPAIHFNLTAANNDATDFLQAPSNVNLKYNGSDQTITGESWYDATFYSGGVNVTYKSESGDSLPVAKNAGKYTVTLEITGNNLAWVDIADKSRTINLEIKPGDITVDYSNSTELKEDNKFEFHAVNGQHILKFPESEYNWETRKIISLIPTATDEDKQSVEIWYYVTTHPENEHDDDAIESGTPNETDTSLWKKYEDFPSDSMFTASAPKGYCVYYMIKAANHATKIGHFSVHIATEILTIYMTDYTLENKIYGQAPHTQDDLLALFQDKVDRIETAGGEQRKDDLTKPENVAKFKFYFTDNAEGTGTRYKTSDDGGGTTRWDVGKYYLQVRYTDGDESYITFKWGDGSSASHPTLTIEPKEVDLVWEGNSNWDSDKEKVSATVSEGNYTAVGDFNWVYDGEKHVPKAYFTDLNGAKIYVQVDGEKDNANMSAQTHKATAKAFDSNGNEIKNYKFGTTEKDDTNGGVEREFRINKAKNSWVERFYTNTLTINDDLNGKIIMPQATFGECIIKYYSQESDRQSQTSAVDYPTQAEGTYYVRVTVEETSNYDGLDSISDSDFTANYQFRVSGCNHLYTMWEIVEGDPEWHMRSCTKCGETFKEKHSPKLKSGSTDIDYQTSADEHWQICKDCNAEFGRIAHSEHEMAGTKEPTCTETGVSEGIECPVCGKVLVAQNVISALGHRFGADVEEVAATCTENGFKRGKCIVCENTATEVLPAKGHKPHIHEAKEATETEDGNIEYWTCDRCNKFFDDVSCASEHEIEEEDTVIPALGASGGISDGGQGGNNNLSGGLSGGGGNESWISRNWLWLLIILVAVFMAAIIIIIILSARRRRKDRQMFEMYMRSQKGGYQPLSSYMDNGRPVVVLQAPPNESGQLQLPQAIDEETLANAIALAMQKLQQPPTDNSASSKNSDKSVHDADGFYENYKPDDDNNK